MGDSAFIETLRRGGDLVATGHLPGGAARPRCGLTHTTRNRPRRADEVLAGGSLYWVIKGVIRARQPIIGLDDVSEQMGRKACQIVLGPELVRVRTRPCRAFQGWRYLEAAKAPDDLPAGSDDGEDLPPTMQKELRALGLL